MHLHDRCQVALLRELSMQGGGRLVLKGGMAMRVSVGSLRLTKDIDFDADESLSLQSLKNTLETGLQRAAINCRLKGTVIDFTKEGRGTTRARLVGNTQSGESLRFEVEVSRRPSLFKAGIQSVTVAPPASYAMAPFEANVYRNEVLCVMKIAAALSANREAERDLYDLYDLSLLGTDPGEVLSLQDEDTLRQWAVDPLGKLSKLTFKGAAQNLLPYIPPLARTAIDEDRWVFMTLTIAEKIEQWCDEALAHKHSPSDERLPLPPGAGG